MSAFDVLVANDIIHLLERQRGVKRAALVEHYDQHRGRVPVAVVHPKGTVLVDTHALKDLCDQYFSPVNRPTFVVRGTITRKARRDFDRLVAQHRQHQPHWA